MGKLREKKCTPQGAFFVYSERRTAYCLAFGDLGIRAIARTPSCSPRELVRPPES